MKSQEYIRRHRQNEVEEKVFPNEKWLEEHGFKVLSKCKDIMNWSSSESEREFLDNTYCKVLSPEVNVHVTDEGRCWKANLFSDSYSVFSSGKNAKDVVEKVFETFKEEMKKLNNALKSIQESKKREMTILSL